MPIVLAISLYAQTAARPAVVPVSNEQHHHLVLENEYVRVYSVEVASHAETLYHQHDLDYIFVTLGDSDVDSVRVGEQPAHLLLKDGEVRFTKGGFAHKAVNNSDKPFKNVTIELKKHFDAEMRICADPMKCVHEIGSGIGESTSLFSNGFITATHHHLKRGGTLSSSYYSAKGKDVVVFVALENLDVNFGGISEQLKTGQIYSSEAGEVEVAAGDDDVRWVVIRLNLPKNPKTAQ
jgi:hypothetical protein